MLDLGTIAIAPGPIESVALCVTLGTAGGPSCIDGTAAGSTRWFSSGVFLYPLTAMGSDEAFAVTNALLGVVPVDETIDYLDGTWPTLNQLAASREFESSYATDQTAVGAPTAMLALRAFAILAGQRIQQIANALGLSWIDAYSELRVAGFQPPIGWLALIDPGYYRWYATDDHHAQISDVGLAYILALHGLMMVEKYPGHFAGMAVAPSTVVSSPVPGDWEDALVATDLTADVRAPLDAQDMLWPYQGDTYTFQLFRSADLWSLARSGLPNVGQAITTAFATLSSAWQTVAPKTGGKFFITPGLLQPGDGTGAFPPASTPPTSGWKFNPNLLPGGGITVTPGGIPWPPPVGIDVSGFTPKEGDACTTDVGRPGKLDASLHCVSAMRIDPGYGVPPSGPCKTASGGAGTIDASGYCQPLEQPPSLPPGQKQPAKKQPGKGAGVQAQQGPDATPPASSTSAWVWAVGGAALAAAVLGGGYYLTRPKTKTPEPKKTGKRAGNPTGLGPSSAITYIREKRAAGMSLDDAARSIPREVRLVLLDRIGMWPSSEPELRAIQRVT